MACQVILRRHPTGKYETRRIDPARCRFLAEVGFSAVIIPQQPQHAAVDGVQQPHPDLKNGRGNLVIVVETTKDKTALWKPGLVPRRLMVRNLPLGIVD